MTTTKQLQHPFEMPLNMKYHVEKVFAGEYSLHEDAQPKVILDLGANVGAFSAWASTIWPDANIYAFEPVKHNFELLQKNMEPYPNVTLFHCAIGNPELNKIFFGQNNWGECSQYQQGEQKEDSEIICVIHPKAIWFKELCASADFIKVDVEGAEEFIFDHVKFTARYVACEYHGETRRRKIDDILSKANYTLVQCNVTAAGYGIVKYEKNPT